MFFEHRRDRPFRNEADDAVDGLAALEEDETRDSRHMILTGEPGILIRIELHETNPPGIRAGNFLDDRRQHLARTAPVGPKIDENGLVARQHLA